MSTSCLFRDDAYLDHCTAKVVEIGDQGIVLDRTVFYATSGGQPGDRGTLTGADGTQTPIATAVYADAQKSVIAHAPAAAGVRPAMGDELAANPGLVKTMAVKPPMGTGRVRLVEISGYDLQPCGGTHVRRTAEIGAVRVTQIEKKGKQNRRVRIGWA